MPRSSLYGSKRRGGGGGALLPFNADFTAGSIPAIFTGSTFAIVSSRLVNTPTLGSEILTDPGLENAYTAGLCGSLTLTDANTNSTLVDETSDVHGGSHAQKATFGDSVDLVQVNTGAGVADKWYQYSVWGKRTAGSNGNSGMSAFQTGMLPDSGNSPVADITSASYTQYKIAFYSTSTNLIFARPAYQISTAGDTIIVDDHSLKQITRSSLYLLANFNVLNGTWKVRPDTFVDNSLNAIVIRADGSSDPTNCIYAVFQKQPRANAILVYLMKKLSATTSVVLTVQTATIVADAWFEVRASGTAIGLYYNGTQISTNQTVADANLNAVGNTYAGIFSTGGNKFKSFFASAS